MGQPNPWTTLYPQNGERIVTIDSVTSIHPMYWCHVYCGVLRTVGYPGSDPFTTACSVLLYRRQEVNNSTACTLSPLLNAAVRRSCITTRHRPGDGETICPPTDGSSTHGGSTSVRGRVRSPYMAKLQAASMSIAYRVAACLWQLRHGTDGRTDGGGYNKPR